MKHRSFLVIAALLLSPSISAAPAKDQKIVALASAAAKCKFDDGSFDDECPAYKAWIDNEPLFADGKGDATILAMFEDADLKMRVLSTNKGFDAGDKVVADKGNAARLIAAVKKETDPGVARSFGSYIARIDFEKMAMEADLRALAKHPIAKFRSALGFHLYADKQTPLRLEVTKLLMDDSDPEVQRNALDGLSMGASRGKAPEACKLMGEQIPRPDSNTLWQVGTSNCTSVYDALATEVIKRATDPIRAAKDGVSLSLAISSMCRAGNDAQKSKGFAAAKLLTDAKVKNVNVRTAGIHSATECDKTASKALLTALSKDSDKTVSGEATKQLAALDKK